MPGRRDHPDLETTDPQHLAVTHVVVPAADGANRAPGQFGEPGCRLGVVVVPVGEDREGHPCAEGLDPVEDCP